MSKTPKTDKYSFHLSADWSDSFAPRNGEEVVPSEIARALELELNAAKEKLAELQGTQTSVCDLVLGYITRAGRDLEMHEIVYQVINENPGRKDLNDYTIKEAIWSLLDNRKIQLNPE